MPIPSGSEVARPFLPSHDFAASSAFSEALKFRKVLDDGEVGISTAWASSFILQRYHERRALALRGAPAAPA